MTLRLRRIERVASLSGLLSAWLAASGLLITSPAIATPCVVPDDCASKFCVDSVCCDTECKGPCEACSAAAKGGGSDGTCGLAAPGSICDPAHCDGDLFAFVDDAICDEAGACIYPTPVKCLHNNPCQFDLCGTDGCDVVLKNDGTSCGGGKVCVDGVCGGGSSAASSSSSSGTGGSGGEGGTGGGGAGGTGGAGETGGSGGDPYPPAKEFPVTCGCRAAEEVPAGGAAAVAMAGLALLVRRRRARG